MGKAVELREVEIAELKPYERNAKQHGKEQVERIAKSIRELGFLSPCLIDQEYNVIAGHGRILAAKTIGLKKVPCVFVEGLTEAQRRAYIIADNRLTELGEWNMEAVKFELEDLRLEGFDLSLTGFEINIDGQSWFDREEKDRTARQEGNDEYNEFLDKFETKKTTDDCYTPDNVYDAVADFVAREWNLNRKDFVRPFYPGGDYQREKYKKGAVVVDNPPFSILSKIIRWYCDNGIRFFLFAPTVTLFTAYGSDVEYMPVGVEIIYENGAKVNTSFINNIGENRIYVSAELYEAVDRANDVNVEAAHKDLPKYNYPDEAMLAAKAWKLGKYGQTLKVPKAECVYQNRLDAQKELGIDAFGGLFLLSEKAAAEKAAAEKAAAEKAAVTKWTLSEREKKIIKSLGKQTMAEV